MSAMAGVEAPAQRSASNGEILLEDSTFLVAFDPVSGALTRLVRKSSGWTIQRRPELGVSFRLLVPLPVRRTNFVLGQKQRATRVEKVSDNQVGLEWTNLVSEVGPVLPITFSATVTLQDGALTFAGTLLNDSNFPVETFEYPYFGDLSAPSRDASMTSEHMWYGNLVGNELYPIFHNEKGYWGVNFPTKTIDSKQSLFALIQTPAQGLYVGMNDPTQPYLMQWTFEQHPGVVQSVSDPVPHEDEISGLPVFLQFCTCHFVFAHPHSMKTLAPVIVRAYDGDWHAGI